MLENEALKKYLEKASGTRYTDIRTVDKKYIRVALLDNSLEVGEYDDSLVGCRALGKGYGVSSTNKIDANSIENALEQAVKHAASIDGTVTLVQVSPEKGSYEHPVKSKPTLDDAKDLIMYVKESGRRKIRFC